MNPLWNQHLHAEQARLDPTLGALDFGDPLEELRRARDGHALYDLSPLGIIEVSGDDAQKFLQGQFTNDVRQVNPARGQMSAWCSAKGRVQSNFWLMGRHGGGYYLVLPAELLAAVLKRLQMYVLRSAVKLRDLSAEWVVTALSGADSAAWLQTCLNQPVPGEVGAGLGLESLNLLRLRGETPNYLLLGEVSTQQDLWACLRRQGAAPAGFHAWQSLQIQAGVPLVTLATLEAFTPQMLNLELLEAVNFKKGCYTGQEIVARTQYLGKVKRRLYRARLDSALCPPPGAEVSATGLAECGKLVNAQALPESGYQVLVVLQDGGVEAGGLRLAGAPLELLSLPYSLGDAA